MMESPSLLLDRQICFRLYKNSRTMTRLYQPFLESMNITYPQYVTMLVLWEERNIDFKELGYRLDLKTGTLTPIIKKLETLGYVERIKNTEDQRKIWVRITERGMALQDNAREIPSLLNTYINMSPEDYKKYIRVLDELGEILEKAEKKQRERKK